MKICVFGAGAVGGHIAARLAQAAAGSDAGSKVELSLVARGAHLAAIQAQGLRVETEDAVLHCRPRASDVPADLGAQDLVVVTTKSHDLPAVAAGVGALSGPSTRFLFIGNGIPWWYFRGHGGVHDGRRLDLLDPGGALAHAIGARAVLGGLAFTACTLTGPGVVRVRGRQPRVVVGSPTGGSDDGLRTFVHLMRQGGCAAEIAPDIRDAVWIKLIGNLAGVPMGVLTHQPLTVSHADPVLAAWIREVGSEAIRLATAMGRTVPQDPEGYLKPMLGVAHRSSMLQDLLAGRPLELDALFTVPLELAAEHGVSMVGLARMAAMVRLRATARDAHAQ